MIKVWEQNAVKNTKKILNRYRKIFKKAAMQTLPTTQPTALPPRIDSQNLLSMAAEIATDGLWDLRLDTLEIHFDQRFYSLTGWSPDAAGRDPRKWASRVHPEDLPGLLKELDTCRKNGRASFDTECRMRTRDGRWIWLHARGKVVDRDPDAHPLQILGVINDITDKKEMERQKDQAEAVLELSEKRYQMVLENAHDAIIIVQGGRIRYANPSTERLLGYSRDEIARGLFDQFIHDDDRQKVAEIHRLRLAGESVPDHYSFRALNRSGEKLWLEINTVNTQWKGAPAIQAFIRDVSQTRQLEKQLFMAQKMQAIGTLAGGIAHDFSNILSSMMGYTEICLNESAADSPLAPRLKRILQAGSLAKDLVAQILSFSRQNDGDLKPVELGPIVEEAAKLLRATLPANITIDLQLTSGMGVIQADPSQVHQIIMNLFVNAVHAMSETGGRISVGLKSLDLPPEKAKKFMDLEPGTYARICVADTGRGMAPDTARRIFEPYFTTKPTGEGTGLGLSVVHGIVTSLGGTIQVDSKPGCGTSFYLYLPEIRCNAETDEDSAESFGGDETILLVEDERLVLDMTTEMLMGMGYKVVPRISSVEALQAFEASPKRFDLVVTDHTMPHMNGSELARLILEIRPDMPVILCTGFSTGLIKEKHRLSGIQAFLKKPVLRAEMARTVRHILDTHHKKATAQPPSHRLVPG